MPGLIDRLYRTVALGLLALALLIAAVLFLTPGAGPGQPTAQNASVVADDLDIPWGIAFLPNGDMLVTERPGTLVRAERTSGEYTTVQEVDGVEHRGEGGLLGIALHPEFGDNRWVYLYMTARVDDGLRNRVVRYRLEEDALHNATTILDDLPGAVYHDGGRLAFGPDERLYITAGDATNRPWAQDTDILAGKILRINPDGSIPGDNPFNNAVYSYGHRNPQGLAWVGEQLWATEHGDTQHDELNRIVAGGNYGWPVIEAGQGQEGMREPEIYADGTTWAPAGAVHYRSSIFFAGLRGSALYEAGLERDAVMNLEKHMEGFGRLRSVELGPDGMLYVSTSNTDGRGVPRSNDDRILRVDPDRWVE